MRMSKTIFFFIFISPLARRPIEPYIEEPLNLSLHFTTGIVCCKERNELGLPMIPAPIVLFPKKELSSSLPSACSAIGQRRPSALASQTMYFHALGRMGRSSHRHLEQRSSYRCGIASSTRWPTHQLTISSAPIRQPLFFFAAPSTAAMLWATLGFSAMTI